MKSSYVLCDRVAKPFVISGSENFSFGPIFFFHRKSRLSPRWSNGSQYHTTGAGQVQGVKVVCVCQAKCATAAARLRGIAHLSPQWVEADLIADDYS